MPFAWGWGSRRPRELAAPASPLQSTTCLMSRELATGYYRGGKKPMGHRDYGDVLSKERF